jgi:hypothetical protein
VVAVAWPCHGGALTCEGGGSTTVMIGSRSERDRSGSALIGGALAGVRRRCGFLDDSGTWR